jgi:hypothetical protein
VTQLELSYGGDFHLVVPEREQEFKSAGKGEFKQVERGEGWAVVTSAGKCGHWQCMTCDKYVEGRAAESSVTKRKYLVYGWRPDLRASCNSENVVYLHTCTKCGLQYVGSTEERLNHRESNRRSSAKKTAEARSEFLKSHSEQFVDHFRRVCGAEKTQYRS